MILLWAILAIFVFFGVFAFVGAPYVPSHKKEVQKALGRLYKISESDVFVDLGSGDGVVVREAAKRGAKVFGVEYNPLLVLISRALAHDGKQTYIIGDMWKYDLPNDTTVVYAFSVSRDTEKLRRKLESHVQGTGKKVTCILYGPYFKNVTPDKTLGAHNLYMFRPKTLQDEEA